MVEQDSVGHEGRQLPLIDEPCAHRRVIGAKLRTLQGQQRFLVTTPRQQGAITAIHSAEQEKLPDIVQ